SLPEAWRCKGSPDLTAEVAYAKGDATTSREPTARSYDIYARSPRQVSALHDALVDYGNDRGIISDDVYSERGFIEPVIRLMNIAWVVGLILQTVPLIVAVIVLWLVVHSLLQRRRQEMLLCLVMGSHPWQLQVQSWFLAVLIIIPGLLLGYFVGALLPGLLIGLMSETDLEAYANVVRHVRAARIDLYGLLQVGALTLFFATFASLSVTRSITETNPAGAFRGTV
ncbi:MAG: hypothetical protein QF464_13220, partial [Myxococcota bacterium]|nr:hypothetical protein [Myxococcota bacterium]